MPVRSALIALLLAACGPNIDTDDPDPTLDGAALYDDFCTECHAEDGAGTDDGPSLLDRAPQLSAAEIAEVILDGEDDMQAIFVSRDEAVVIALYAKQTFGQ